MSDPQRDDPQHRADPPTPQKEAVDPEQAERDEASFEAARFLQGPARTERVKPDVVQGMEGGEAAGGSPASGSGSDRPS